ncbi:MAG: TIGR00341 family protein [Candidatus Thorarchaeota archaeon]
MKQMQVVLPYDKTDRVMDLLIDQMAIKNVLRYTTDNAHVLQFRLPEEHVIDVIERLKAEGVGVDYGFIDVLDLRTSLPRESVESKERVRQREATLAVEEIYEQVKARASLSFDFVAFVILAGAIAGLGLLEDNGTVILASMLLSPLMGPMLGVAFGYVVSDRSLFIRGTRNELTALTIAFGVGAVLGLLVALAWPEFPQGVNHDLQNGVLTEITRRNGFIILDLGIAVFSGAAVAVSITRGDMSSLVGVAISASLMPPAVNFGMCLAMGAVSGLSSVVSLAFGSLGLLVMNIIAIDIAAIVMFKIKKLSPIRDRSARWTAVTALKMRKSSELYHAGISGETDTASSAVVFRSAKDENHDGGPT